MGSGFVNKVGSGSVISWLLEPVQLQTDPLPWILLSNFDHPTSHADAYMIYIRVKYIYYIILSFPCTLILYTHTTLEYLHIIELYPIDYSIYYNCIISKLIIQHKKYKPWRQYPDALTWTMVLILDGSSEHGARILS